MPSKAVVIIVASFLLVIFIYGSAAKFHVFASYRACQNTNYNSDGSIDYICCWNSGDTSYCQSCRLETDGSTTCNEPYPVRSLPTGTLAPGNLTNAPPTGNNTGKTGGLSPIGIPTNAPPTNNNTGTVPPGSIIKVLPGTFNPAGNATEGVIKVPPLIPTNPSNNTGGTPPPPPTGLAGPGCGPGTDNSTCPATSNLPTPTAGCGPGTDNSTCSTSTSNQSAAAPTLGCGPGTDNSTCSSSSTPNPTQSVPTSGCGPGTDNSTCSTSTPNAQSTHNGSNLAQTGASTSGGNTTK